MRGVIVFGVDDGVARWARFYLEPVVDDADTVDDAVRAAGRPMILVAGGSGRLGTLVVKRLADRGLDVRVLTRDPSRARHLGDAAIDIVEGDVRNRASLERAVEGVSVVVSAVHGFVGPGRVTPCVGRS